MKSFMETMETPRKVGLYTPNKPLTVQQLILYEVPKTLVKELFFPNEKGETLLNYMDYIKKRDGVRLAYLTQAYCAWMYGEILKNKPEIAEMTGVTVKELEDFYLKVFDTNLFSYNLIFFNTMFGKPNSYPHPLLVLTVYLREMLRIASGSDALAEGIIDAFDNDMEKRMLATLIITPLGNLIVDVIRNRIAQKG